MTAANLALRPRRARLDAWSFGFAAALAVAALAGPTAADVVALSAAKDNTLYSTLDGSLSNGAGEHIFAGNTAGSEQRRGVIEFDLSDVPAGATVTDAVLRLYMSKSRTGVQDVAVRRVLAEWGEGLSDAEGEEGFGAPATAGDATWLHTSYSDWTWTSAGGDFVAEASATSAVGGTDFYTWTSAALIADVQAWVADPSVNHGWILIGAESGPQTAKRFDSRQNGFAEQRPTLTVTFTAPVFCPGDSDCDGDVDFFDIDPFVAKLGCPSSDPVACSDGCPWQNADTDLDGDVDFFDIDPFVALLGQMCQ